MLGLGLAAAAAAAATDLEIVLGGGTDAGGGTGTGTGTGTGGGDGVAVAATFGADTPVGAGGAPTTLPDGTHGEFTALAGRLSPNVSPLTPGRATLGPEGATETIDVVRATHLDLTVADQAEFEALDYGGLTTAATPDVTIRVRAGATIPHVGRGGGGTSAVSKVYHGRVTVLGEGDGDDRPVTHGGSPRYIESVDADPSRGFALRNFRLRPDPADPYAGGNEALFTLQNMDGCTFALRGCEARGLVPYDPHGDYGAKVDYAGLSGAFQVGESISAPGMAGVRDHRRILEVRDAGDGTGTLVIDDGSGNGQSPNRVRQTTAPGDVLTGTVSGATATLVGVPYNTRPKGVPRLTTTTGSRRPARVVIEDVTVLDLHNPVNAVAEREVVVRGCTVERYTGDAFTITPDLADRAPEGTRLVFEGNRARLPIVKSTDLGNPHADGLQVNSRNGQAHWSHARFAFNQMMDGDTRGRAQQIFIQGAAHFRQVEIVGNVVSGHGQVNGIVGVGGPGSRVHNNTIFREEAAGGGYRAGANEPSLRVSEGATYQFNVAPNAAEGAAHPDRTVVANKFVRHNGDLGPDPIEAFLAGLGGAAPFHVATFAEQFAAAAPAPGADPLAGARGTPVDWAARAVATDHLIGPPAPFAAADWDVADTTHGGTLEVTVAALPEVGGLAVEALEYRLDDGPARVLANLEGPGAALVSGLADDVAVAMSLRVRTAAGAGPWAEAKTRTPTLVQPDGIVHVGRRLDGAAGNAGPWVQPLAGLTGGIGAAPAPGDWVLHLLARASSTDRKEAFLSPGWSDAGGPAHLYLSGTPRLTGLLGHRTMGDPVDAEVAVGGNQTSAEKVVQASLAWRGVDPAAPMDVAPLRATGRDAPPQAPAAAPATPGALVVVAALVAHVDAEDRPLSLTGGTPMEAVAYEVPAGTNGRLSALVGWAAWDGEAPFAMPGIAGAPAVCTWAVETIVLRPA